MKKKQLAAEVTMMLAAQQMVDRWLRSPGRGPFSRAVAKEERERWSDFPEMEPYRRAFRRVANAIRMGEGHAVANPGPLLEIARRSLRSFSRQ
jgi:hypothetical protein